MASKSKHLGNSTRYKNVYMFEKATGEVYYMSKIGNSRMSKPYKSDYEAAKALDLLLMKKGKAPINIFKKS